MITLISMMCDDIMNRYIDTNVVEIMSSRVSYGSLRYGINLSIGLLDEKYRGVYE